MRVKAKDATEFSTYEARDRKGIRVFGTFKHYAGEPVLFQQGGWCVPLDPDTEVTLLAPVAETWKAACEAILDEFGENLSPSIREGIATLAANPEEPPR